MHPSRCPRPCRFARGIGASSWLDSFLPGLRLHGTEGAFRHVVTKIAAHGDATWLGRMLVLPVTSCGSHPNPFHRKPIKSRVAQGPKVKAKTWSPIWTSEDPPSVFETTRQ